MAGMETALEFTGERFTPECVREILYEHFHRYAWASRWVADREVLDCACGEGYGSALLARHAARVDGVDIDAESIEHARSRYVADHLEFHLASALDLPFENDRFDAVVSFETLEHLAEQEELLDEFRRVLRPEGFLLLSSPDRKTYSDESGYDNPFHVRELYRDEFEALLSRHFGAYRLFGQKLMFHSALWAMGDAEAGHESLTLEEDHHLTRKSRPDHAPLYFIAVAAARDENLPSMPGLSLFDDRAESVYAHYNHEIRAHIRAGELLAERDAEIERLRQQVQPVHALSTWQRFKKRLTGR